MCQWVAPYRETEEKMLRRLSEWLYRVINGWVVLIGLAIFIVFMALLVTGQFDGGGDFPEDVGVPDLSLYYSADTLYEWAEAYGEDGRRDYIYSFDLVWPLAYGFFLVTAITWLFGKAFPDGSLWRLANLVPLAGVLFDYLENISNSLVMYRFPQETPVVASLAGIFTLLKWPLVGGGIILLIVGLIAAIWKGITNKSSSTQ
jgi:hypothetical protein